MADMQTDINRILNDFAAQLLKVFREAVVTSLGGGGGSSRSLPAAPKRRGRPPKAPPAAAPAAARRKASKRGPKSTPKEVEALQAQILDALKGGAKLSSSELVKALKVDPGPFQYALGKLKSSNQVSQLGERRMAKYSLGGSAKKSAKGAKGARKKSAKGGESGDDQG
jgi:hypothetical protein